jgi:hypothetical protein
LRKSGCRNEQSYYPALRQLSKRSHGALLKA